MMQKRFSFSHVDSTLLLVALAVFCWSPPSSWADPVLPHLLTDHMVLQQDREIHIWGKADPGEKITVTLAQKASSSDADADGRWSVQGAGSVTVITAKQKHRYQAGEEIPPVEV